MTVLAAIPEVRLAPGAVDALAPAAAARAATVLLLVDPALVPLGLVDRLAAGLAAAGARAVVHIPPAGEPAAADIARAAAAARAAGAGAVIGVGGGSALDAAKLAALCAAPGAAPDPMAYALAARPLPHGLPAFLAPSTAGAGAEASATCVFAGPDGDKLWAWGAEAKPVLVALDPALGASLPPFQTAASGLDALVHAFEAATNRNAHAAACVHAHAALRLIAEALPRAVADGGDLAAREAMLLGAFHAGVAIDACGTAIAHALSHALAGLAPAPHGLVTALAFELTLPWLVAAPTPRIAAAAAALGTTPAGLPAAISRLFDACALPRALPGACAEVAPDALVAAIDRPANQPMLRNTVRAAAPADLQRFAADLLALAPKSLPV